MIRGKNIYTNTEGEGLWNNNTDKYHQKILRVEIADNEFHHTERWQYMIRGSGDTSSVVCMCGANTNILWVWIFVCYDSAINTEIQMCLVLRQYNSHWFTRENYCTQWLINRLIILLKLFNWFISDESSFNIWKIN